MPVRFRSSNRAGFRRLAASIAAGVFSTFCFVLAVSVAGFFAVLCRSRLPEDSPLWLGALSWRMVGAQLGKGVTWRPRPRVPTSEPPFAPRRSADVPGLVPHPFFSAHKKALLSHGSHPGAEGNNSGPCKSVRPLPLDFVASCATQTWETAVGERAINQPHHIRGKTTPAQVGFRGPRFPGPIIQARLLPWTPGPSSIWVGRHSLRK
jgi:hypothetical protein